MPTSSPEASLSNVQVRPVPAGVSAAVGAWFAGAPTLNVWVVVLVRPPASLTVSVTVRGPPCGYVTTTTAPVAVGFGNRPSSQSKFTIPASSVEPEPSRVHVRPAQATVKFATGAAFAGGGVGVLSANALNRSRFGELSPGSWMTLAVAFVRSAVATAAGVAFGFVSRNNAAAPVTCGVAIEVPLNTAVCVSEPLNADGMSTPGANRSRHGPTLE